jgi:hypothetical protein
VAGKGTSRKVELLQEINADKECQDEVEKG